ncbi:MAG: hypothetical protein LBQ20_07170 [Rhodanobacter sp.]|jgi:hypothetical protein|nr:hypothetical protein [Rhodanobacter sp.]
MFMKFSVALVLTFVSAFCFANSRDTKTSNNDTKADLKTEVDRFTEETNITMHELLKTDTPWITAHLKYDVGKKGQALLAITLYTTANDGLKYLRCHSLQWLADGKPVKMPKDVIHEGKTGNGYIIEVLIQMVDIATIDTLATSSKIEFKVCADEFVAADVDLKTFKDFARQIHEHEGTRVPPALSSTPGK